MNRGQERGAGFRGRGQHRGQGSSRGFASASGRGHPSGLRGKDIGMYYAKKSQAKKMFNRSNLTLNPHQMSQIEDEITHLKRLTPFPKTRTEARDSKFWEKFRENKLQNFWSDCAFINPDRDEEEMLKNEEDDEMIDDPELGLKSSRRSVKMRKQFEGKMSSTNYKSMMKFRENLPAFKMKDEIVNTVWKNQVTVISGETGCGKTTQVIHYY
jgi:ATP-dependent RNA helicase DHX36